MHISSRNRMGSSKIGLLALAFFSAPLSISADTPPVLHPTMKYTSGRIGNSLDAVVSGERKGKITGTLLATNAP